MNQAPPLFQDEVAARNALDEPRFNVLAPMLRMWQSFWPYADGDFVTKIGLAVGKLHTHGTPGPERECACAKFQQVWWEMFVGCALLDRDITLVPRAGWDKSRTKSTGPDLLAIVNGHRVWIECHTPGTGDKTKEDHVPEVTDAPVQQVPVDQIKLRLTNAIRTKRCQWASPAWASIVKPTDGFVIAINSRCVSPLGILDRDASWIASVVYGLGALVVPFDLSTNTWGEPVIAAQPTIPKKKNAEPVPAARFVTGTAPEVSGLLYSRADAWNLKREPFSDLVYLPNPTATVRLPAPWPQDRLP